VPLSGRLKLTESCIAQKSQDGPKGPENL
jgi:hypothetical protein